MEAGGDFDERADTAVDCAMPARRAQDLRQELERRGFSGAVRAYDADRAAPIDREGDVADGPKLLLTEVSCRRVGAREYPPRDRRNEIAEAGVSLAALEFLPNVIEDYDRIAIHK